jgi:hypothetical protein
MAAEAEGLQIRPLDGNCKSCLTRIGLLMEGPGILKRVGFADHFACMPVRQPTSYEPRRVFAVILISSAPPAS